MARSSSYSWMPGWLRKFLNLDDELPGYGPSSAGTPSDYAPPARRSLTSPPPTTGYAPPTTSYTPPATSYKPPEAPPIYKPSYPLTTPAGETTPRFAASYSPPPPPPSSSASDEPKAPSGTGEAPPPTPPRTVGTTGAVQQGGAATAGGAIPSVETHGYVQPIGYGIRSYVRGALPPQGLEQFTRELRATLTDVWNFYSYWTRFQTDELFRMGGDAMNAVVDVLPGGGTSPSASGAPRRIKVNVGNGNGEKQAERAAPPPPPAPTARFSSTVTADDAEVPPAGRDTATDFSARMAQTSAEVQRDVAEESGKAAEALKAEAKKAADQSAAAAAEAKKAADQGAAAADKAAKDAADKAKGPGNEKKSGG